MPLFKEEYKKEEKINGVIYDMSPSPNDQHGIVNGNIYRIISGKLQPNEIRHAPQFCSNICSLIA